MEIISNQQLNDKVVEFIAFCIENYKIQKGLAGRETKFLFDKYGLIDYLLNGYEVLHTQGKEYIMRDIDDFIENRKP